MQCFFVYLIPGQIGIWNFYFLFFIFYWPTQNKETRACDTKRRRKGMGGLKLVHQNFQFFTLFSISPANDPNNFGRYLFSSCLLIC